MAEPLFSLVVATAGRSDELHTLFASLAAQSCQDFEVILADQNPDERLVPIVAAFAGRLKLIHLRTPVRKISHARNVGIARGRGALVGFPDDDCCYPPDLLATVAGEFAARPNLGVVTGVARSPDGKIGSGRWSSDRTPITRINVFTTVIAFNLFIRRDLLNMLGGFDERLGVGAEFGACEETDLAIRAIAAKAELLFDPAIAVEHPDKRLTAVARDRAFNYGSGLGRVLRKHRYGPRIVATYLIRPAGGIVVSALRGRGLASSYHWRTLRGRVAGYLARHN